MKIKKLKTMKIKKKNVWAVVAALLLLSSCGASREMARRQGEAVRRVGEAHMASMDYTSALREFLKAEKLSWRDHQLQNDLGLVYMAKNSLEDAEESFKKALRLKGDYSDAWNNLGSVYLAMKQWDDAIYCNERIIDDLTYATPHYPLANLGWAYYNKKEYATAETHYQRALEFKPGFAMAWRDLGRTYMAMGKMSKAVNALSRGIKAAPSRADAYFYLGHAWEGAGRPEKAVENHRRAMALWPGSRCAEDAEKQIVRIEKKMSEKK